MRSKFRVRGYRSHLIFRIRGESPSPQPSPREVRGEEAFQAAAGIGNAVTDLIFSIAKREVTFFSGTAPISFL